MRPGGGITARAFTGAFGRRSGPSPASLVPYGSERPARRRGQGAAGVAAEGRWVVGVSHDLVAVEREADRVVVLANGAVRGDGPPTEVTERAGASSLRDAVSAVANATASERAVRPAEGSR